MIPHYTKIHTAFKINNCRYSFEDLREVAYSHIKEGLPYEKIVGDFLIDWLDAKDYVLVKTSGSTGEPKTIKLKKQAMVNSAIATGDYFKLKPRDSALHCLSTEFIAGKMMLVRAMILGLELDITEPISNPLINTNKTYDFSAMVPFQVEKSLEDINQIKTLIVGGARVSNTLLKDLQKVTTNVYATYGMTETITHIAVKSLNNLSLRGGTTWQSFKVLSQISITQDKRNCLTIEAPHLFEGKIVTNDIVKIHSSSEFELLGRYDNVINSGGVKLFPEQIENKLSEVIEQRFFIASVTDETLGEKVILVIEGDNNLPKSVFSDLDKYEIPKAIYSVANFIETKSGKLQRQKTMNIAISLG